MWTARESGPRTDAGSALLSDGETSVVFKCNKTCPPTRIQEKRAGGSAEKEALPSERVA